MTLTIHAFVNRAAASLVLFVTTMIALPTCGQGLEVFIGSSPNPVGSGARAMGQGNAFIAIADDATAASWNPGGLSQLERPEISFAVEAVSQRDGLNPGDRHPESSGTAAVDFQNINFFSTVVPYFYHRNMVFSLSYLQLYQFDKDLQFPLVTQEGIFTADANVAFRQRGTFSVLAPAFGIDITPKLALGVTLNIWNHSITDSSRYDKVTTTSGDFVFDSGGGTVIPFDTSTFESFEVEEGYSWVIGAVYRMSKAWTVGAVLKPAFDMDLDHSTFTINTSGTTTVTQGPTKGDAVLRQPLIIGLGGAWRPDNSWTVSTDITWTQWSRYAIRENGISTNPLTGTSVELDDTRTVRIGAEYVIVLDDALVPIRCGIGYDPAPGVGEDDDYYTVSCGAGIQLKERINIDVAYEYRWGSDVNAAILRDLGFTEDIRRHRVLASVIVYF